MSYNLDKEFNLLKEMPDLEKAVFNQKQCNCCWAITVATVIGYLYNTDEKKENFEVSPQDILDRVWHYFQELVADKERDEAGCYVCSPIVAFAYIKAFGVGFLADYKFEARLNEHKGEIHRSEFPRVFTGEPRIFGTIQEVIHTLKEEKKAVVGSIGVTQEFASYTKEMGVYRHPPGTTKFIGKHGVVIVGVNEEENYFIIRNSWGSEWGENGYARVDFGAFFDKFYTPSSAYLERYPKST